MVVLQTIYSFYLVRAPSHASTCLGHPRAPDVTPTIAPSVLVFDFDKQLGFQTRIIPLESHLSAFHTIGFLILRRTGPCAISRAIQVSRSETLWRQSSLSTSIAPVIDHRQRLAAIRWTPFCFLGQNFVTTDFVREMIGSLLAISTSRYAKIKST